MKRCVWATGIVFAASGASAQFSGFESGGFYPTGTSFSPETLEIADLTGDRRPEFIYTSNAAVGDQLLRWRINDGSGGFGPIASLSFAATGLSTGPGIAAADFNNDGNVDVAIANIRGSIFTPSLVVALGNGAGGFTLQTRIDLPGSVDTFRVYSIAAGEVTGDANTDLVLIDNRGTERGLVTLRGDGAGGFTADRFSAFDTLFDPDLVRLGDMDSDGDLDAVLNGRDSNDRLLVFENDGNARFITPPKAFGTGSPNTGYTGNTVSIVDVTADGLPDLVTSRADVPQQAVILINDPVNGFTTAGGLPFTGPAVQLPVLAADFTLDGVGDVINTLGVNTITISYREAIANGVFEPLVIDAGVVGAGNTGRLNPLRAADLDGNGIRDIIAVTTLRNIAVLLASGSAPAPGAFSLVSPADNAAKLPTPDQIAPWGTASAPRLTWEPAQGVSDVTYRVTIARDAALTDVLLDQPGITGTEFTLPTGVIGQGQTFHWAVAATAGGPSTASTPATRTFTTQVSEAEVADISQDGQVNVFDILVFLGLVDDVDDN